MARAILQDWSVRSDPYQAPEARRAWLVGRVFGSASFNDGECIATGAVTEACGRVVTTASGSVYRLGRVCKDYRAWLREQGTEYDPSHPVKVVDTPEEVQRGHGA